MNESKKMSLELYRVINQKLGEEVHETYLINSTYLVVNAGLLAFISQSNEILLSFIICAMGIVVSSFWYKSVKRAKAWRDYWFDIAKRIEKRLGSSVTILRNADSDMEKMWGKRTGIVTYLKVLSILFIICWGIVSFLFSLRFLCSICKIVHFLEMHH